MGDQRLYSKFYATDLTKNEDKQKFRSRILKFLEDFMQMCFPADTYRLCRTEMGVTIKTTHGDRHRHDIRYHVEDTFTNSAISDILDLITVVYDSVASRKQELSSPHKENFENYIRNVNRILQEEAMCYVLNDDGRIRYYPDEEFHKSVKCTLAVLNAPKYIPNLKAFNEALDELYTNTNKESPIHEFFKCVETLALSLNADGKFKTLNDSLADTLMNKIKEKTDADSSYAVHDKEAAENIRGIFLKWINMCNKYRHGKSDQVNNTVPPELFNQIFSTGIALYRFLLEIDVKYNLK